MKYTVLNENGLPTAFYSDDIHSDIPSDAIEITEDQWLECINNSGNRKFVNGSLVEYIEAVTPEQMKASIVTAVQAHLDSQAQSKGYDSILSATSYAGYPNDFQLEGIAFGTLRANVWKYCFTQLAEIESGERPIIPTVEEFIAELPLIGV